MPSNQLILCRPLLLLPSIFPSIKVFSSESVLQIRWPRYCSFSFSISLSNEYSGLISFRMDWLDPCSPRDSQESSPIPHFKSMNSSALSCVYPWPLSWNLSCWWIVFSSSAWRRWARQIDTIVNSWSLTFKGLLYPPTEFPWPAGFVSPQGPVWRTLPSSGLWASANSQPHLFLLKRWTPYLCTAKYLYLHTFPPDGKQKVPLFLIETVMFWIHPSLPSQEPWVLTTCAEASRWPLPPEPHLLSLSPPFPAPFPSLALLSVLQILLFLSKNILFLLSQFPAFHWLLSPGEISSHQDDSG